MKGDELARRRLVSQGLAGRRFTAVEQVVREFGAVQGQDYGPSAWSLGQRAPGTTIHDVHRAVDHGTILRAHLLRPTWQLVDPADIVWIQRLTGPRVQRANAGRYRQLGLDRGVLERATELIGELLRGGNFLIRAEVATALTDHGISVEGQRLPHILLYAELEGVMCSGPRRGRHHTYALLAERAPTARDLPREAALTELALRYFRTHGPATVKDMSWWCSLTQADIRKGLEPTSDQLTSAVVDGLTYYWAASTDADPRRRDPDEDRSAVRLIPPLDEYVVGYTQSRFLLDQAGYAGSGPSRSFYTGLVLSGTQVAGAWRRTGGRDRAQIDIVGYRSFSDREKRSLHDAIDQYGSFFGVPVSIGEVS